MQKGERFVKLGNIAVYANDFDECIYVFNFKDKSIKNLYKTENGMIKFILMENTYTFYHIITEEKG